jgi:hypothetical protein
LWAGLGEHQNPLFTPLAYHLCTTGHACSHSVSSFCALQKFSDGCLPFLQHGISSERGSFYCDSIHSKSKCNMLMCVPACCVWQDWTGEDSGIRAAHCGAAAGPQHFRDKATAGQDSARHRAGAHPRARKAGLPFTISHALHPTSTLCSSSHNRLGGINTLLKTVKDGQISEHILAWCMADRTLCFNI